MGGIGMLGHMKLDKALLNIEILGYPEREDPNYKAGNLWRSRHLIPVSIFICGTEGV